MIMMTTTMMSGAGEGQSSISNVSGKFSVLRGRVFLYGELAVDFHL